MRRRRIFVDRTRWDASTAATHPGSRAGFAGAAHMKFALPTTTGRASLLASRVPGGTVFQPIELPLQMRFQQRQIGRAEAL